MVNATIDSLLALDWPAHEILVIDNNTADPALWLPVQAHVRQRLRSAQPPAATARRCASSTCRRTPASRPARSTSRSNKPMRGRHGLPWSMPTTWCGRSGCANWPAISAIRRWASCRHRRPTATGTTGRCDA
jgi:hypothetical protein